MKFSDLTRGQLKVLANSHIRRFEKILSSCSSMVRAEECASYLRTWKRVLYLANSAATDKIARDNIVSEERAEVRDALECGDYDELLKAAAG